MFIKKKGKHYDYPEHVKQDQSFRRQNPFYKKFTDDLRDSQPPFSLISTHFMPDIKTKLDENIRYESNIGRYPLGFRHYENYYNYLLKHPKASISDYQNDINSQCTFDEFMAIRKSDFLYKCKYDSLTIYENGLNDINPENPKHY